MLKYKILIIFYVTVVVCLLVVLYTCLKTATTGARNM